jgi:hypothetical protein
MTARGAKRGVLETVFRELHHAAPAPVPVIALEKGEELSTTCPQAPEEIEGSIASVPAESRPRLQEDDLVGVVLLVFQHDFITTIGGAIVSNDDFVIERAFLHEDAIDGLTDECDVLICVKYDADGWDGAKFRSLDHRRMAADQFGGTIPAEGAEFRHVDMIF